MINSTIYIISILEDTILKRSDDCIYRYKVFMNEEIEILVSTHLTFH